MNLVPAQEVDRMYKEGNEQRMTLGERREKDDEAYDRNT
jgi:hypothetical protein